MNLEIPRTFTRQALADATHTGPAGVRALERSGQVQRVRRNGYVQGDAVRGPGGRQLALVLATAGQLEAGSVLSHESAAILHGLPLWRHQPTHVMVTRPAAGHGQVRRLVHVRHSTLHPDEVRQVHGVPVTSPARTAIDLARTLPFDAGVAVVDAALAAGTSHGELADVLTRMRGWPGTARAHRVLAMSDARAESPAESVSRVRIAEAGLPEPDLQVELRDADGHLLGRFDFGWHAQRVLGECDGAAKYDDQARHGRSAGDLVLTSTRRDRAASLAGWRVVHWGVTEIVTPGMLAACLRPLLV